VHCFCDLDGTLANFDQHVIANFGVHPHEITDDLLWSLVKTIPDFWLTMPLNHRAHLLWDFIQAYNPVILTGCPASLYDTASAQKVQWAKTHFGEDVSVITCLTREKVSHMLSPQDILIDDFGSTVRRWRKAGGRAVHFRTIDQAISHLRILLNDQGPD
jgi:hypothetical protein